MKRVIELNTDVQADRKHFRLLCDALITRGSQSRNPQTGELSRLSKEDMRADARIKRALWAIGEPDTEAGIPEPKGDEVDRRPRMLVGGTLALDQPDFSKLQAYCAESQWTIAVIEDAMELLDRLDAATQVSETGVPEQKPRLKRA